MRIVVCFARELFLFIFIHYKCINLEMKCNMWISVANPHI
jgi:hypothetical protein